MEITKEALKRQGYELKIKIVPWKRAVQEVERGKADMLLLAYYTDERSKKMIYPKNHVLSSEVVLVGNKGVTYNYKSLEDLKNYSVGILRGGSISKEFDSADFIKKIEVGKNYQQIKMLMKKRVDLIADSKRRIIQVFKEQFPDQDIKNYLQILSPPLLSNKIYNCFSRKNPNHKKLAADFDKGMESIKKDGTFNKILKEHGFLDLNN